MLAWNTVVSVWDPSELVWNLTGPAWDSVSEPGTKQKEKREYKNKRFSNLSPRMPPDALDALQKRSSASRPVWSLKRLVSSASRPE